jgi:isoleucyl-tRNA synthetase
MAITLVGQQPYRRVLTYEKVYDETGREMHKSWGNAIELDEALERMGADIMRWLYCSQPPSQPLRFGYGMAEEAKRRFLTFWNSAKFFVDYANVQEFRPTWSELLPPDLAAPLDRWLVERTNAFVLAAEAAYEAYDTVEVTREFEAYLDDLSNWYIRRSRRRFWGDDEAALRTLWYALVQSLRVLAPIQPFVTDELWRTLVLDGPESVHLAGWPEVAEPDRALLAEIAEVRRVVELGRQARAKSGVKLRQPLPRLRVIGATHALSHTAEILDELRIKDLETGGPITAAHALKPDLPKLGPKLGPALREVREALQRGDAEPLPNGGWRVSGYELAEDEVIVERRSVGEGWALAQEGEIAVLVETDLDDELRLEGEAYELIHRVNSLRKEQGFELSDRVVLTVPEEQRALVDQHGEWIGREVLATEIRIGGDELKLEKS